MPSVLNLNAYMLTSILGLFTRATHAANSSDFTSSIFCEKFSHIPCRLDVKKPVFREKSLQFLAGQTRDLKSKSVVFSSQNENDELERGGSSACTDDSMLTALGNDGSNPEKEAVDSLLHYGADHSQSAENLGNQGCLLDKLKAVHLHILAMEQWNASRLKLCHRSYSVSAGNLIHFLALKSLDVAQLKEDLSSVGLLNLETINPHVIASLSAGIQTLENLKSNSLNSKGTVDGVFNSKSLDKLSRGEFKISKMTQRASSNRVLLFGPLQDDRASHIMVTVGQEALESDTLLNDLLKTGTTIMRINCAHGNQNVWSEIIRRIRSSSHMLEKPCRVLMDLAGPKLRTDKMKPGPCVMRLSPKKNGTGNVVFPAQVWLSPQGAGAPPAHLSPDALLFVDGEEFLSKLKIGDAVRFSDARGKRRMLKISKKFPIFAGVGFIAECTRTAYVQSGTQLCIRGNKSKPLVGFVVDVPPVEQFVRLRVGDLLTISRDSSNEQDEATTSKVGVHRVTCSSGYLFDSVKPGEPIAFDDGKIWGVIKGTSISEIIVSITHAGPKGTKLGSEKSINIPESSIRFEGLTSKDLMDLDFVATHADMVGISFVRDVRDIVVLNQELAKRKLRNLGIILKIETKGGFENLSLMLLEAMKSSYPLGVMIARGDLAVECGWEKLADLQDEILSICSAAHVPVIWATQVLESLVKSGVPTRAEITDVANGRRASCIMLNKGKHVVEAVSTLNTILKGSSKKVNAELKPLAISRRLV
ncbi:hypothetical protein RJ640_023203 [Escallonia rubra]|uniref:pyruvate kinase n=1 Tax=Escallonia rubra TaxID=112253 RepID=A0AA88UG54_9ASTE|nr:hypothetical protein RJ640_023203 [Escallonia rubra]